MRGLAWLVTLMCILVIVKTGECLTCYHCTNASLTACSDPMLPDGIPQQTCQSLDPNAPRISPFEPRNQVVAPACVRFDGYDDTGTWYTVRGCSPYGVLTCGALIQAAAAEGSVLENCQTCPDDLCNGGPIAPAVKKGIVSRIHDFLKSWTS